MRDKLSLPVAHIEPKESFLVFRLAANMGRPPLKISASPLTGACGSNLKHFSRPQNCRVSIQLIITDLDFRISVSASIFDVAPRLHTFAKFENLYTI